MEKEIKIYINGDDSKCISTDFNAKNLKEWMEAHAFNYCLSNDSIYGYKINQSDGSTICIPRDLFNRSLISIVEKHSADIMRA